MQIEAFGCGLCWNDLWQHWPIPVPWSEGDSPTSFQSEQITKLITLVQLCKTASHSGFLSVFPAEIALTTFGGRKSGNWEQQDAVPSPAPNTVRGCLPGVIAMSLAFGLDEV